MIVGIDLGTTNSLIACFTEEGPKIIPNRLGKNLTPSVVSVDEEGNVDTDKENEDDNVLTGDSNMILPFICLLAAAMLGTTVIMKRRRG